MRSPFSGLLIATFAASAFAKLPPQSDEAKGKAAETTAKTAWSEKVSLYKHCLVTEQIGRNYGKAGAAAARMPTPGASATGATVIPSCEDPGPFAMPTPAVAAASGAKPLEASGAHSPATTAATPPSTKPTAAELNANPQATPVTATKDKPIEASEAHSRPGTAVSPPSVNATAKELETGKK